MNNTFMQKTRLVKAGLLLSVSILTVTNAFANNSQALPKDASLVAFYKEVFGKTLDSKKQKKVIRKRVIKTRDIKLPNDCISSPPGSETEFSLDLRKQREQKNLSLLMGDVNIVKQTGGGKNELSRIKNIDTEIFLDLLQDGANAASITLGERKIRCKQVQATKTKVIKTKPTKPKTVIHSPKPNEKITEVELITPVVEIEPPPEKIIDLPKNEPLTSEPLNKEVIIEKNTLMSQSQAPINRKCSATPESSNTNNTDMSALFAKAFGKKNVITKPSKISASLRANTANLGDIDLFSNASGSIDEVDTQILIKLLEDVLKDHVFLRVQKALGESKKTRLCTLNELGIVAFYNSTNLSLDLEINPELRKPQILSLLYKKKANVREENRVEAETVSGFLNAYTTVGLNSQDEEADLRMRLEGSLNIGGVVLETKSDYRNEEFDHGRTTLTYDRPEKLQRFSLGNVSTGSRNFQENLELDGFRISKEFFLDPDLQISPKANESLQLDSDSEVELYVNNQLIRRFYLNAGVYSLQDIGLYNGANNIRIRIKDEFGKVTVKTSQQYYDSHLLKPGLSLFAISVGYLSNQQAYSNSALEKSPIFSGYYQKGISKDLTISLDAQLSSDNYLLGAESISSIALGSIINSVAISGGKNRETGFATSFEFKPNKKQEQISLDTLRQDLLGLDTRSRGFLSNWSITGEYRSEDFSELNGTDPDLITTAEDSDGNILSSQIFNNNQLKANLQTNFSLNISDKWNGTLNLGMADYHNSGESYYSNLSATRRFESGSRLTVGTRYDTEDKFSMNLQFSMPLSRKKGKRKIDLDVLTDTRDNSYETKLNIKPAGTVGKNSLAGSLEHYEDKNSRQQKLDLQYRDTHFESNFSARNRFTKNSKSRSQEFNIGFNTAIACVGGSCAPSYPINDSFALVSGPSNQTQPIALSNNNLRFRYSEGNDTGLPDDYSALIPGKGKKAVVRLESFRTQNINIDEGTLPNGYDSEKTEFSVFPKYHQGFVIKAGGEPASVIDGMLLDEENKVLPFKGGQWTPEGKGKTIAFFSNKGGSFRVSSIPAGSYKLELFDYPDMDPITIKVPDTKGKTHNIGKLIIKTPN